MSDKADIRYKSLLLHKINDNSIFICRLILPVYSNWFPAILIKRLQSRLNRK